MPGARILQECLARSGAAQAGGALGGTFGALGGVPITLPDFLMIGAPRAGTTALPAIAIPAVTLGGRADGNFPATDHQPLQPPPRSRRSS